MGEALKWFILPITLVGLIGYKITKWFTFGILGTLKRIFFIFVILAIIISVIMVLGGINPIESLITFIEGIFFVYL